MLTTIFTGCSLGVTELRELTSEDVTSSAYGLYVIPQSVQYCGRLVCIEAYGNTSISIQQNSNLLQVLTYQKLCDGTFRETSRNNINTNHLDNSIGYIALNLNVAVQEGDLIGIRIPSGCRRQGQCLFQPTIESDAGTEVWYSEVNDINMLQSRTDILLNVQATIGNTDLAWKSLLLISSFIAFLFLLEPSELLSCPLQVSDSLPPVVPVVIPVEEGLSQKRK